MRMPRLLFLIFFFVDGILLHVAALDDPSSNLTAPNVTELSKPHLPFVDVRKLDNHGGEERGAVLENVLEKMKQIITKSLGAACSPCHSGFAQARPSKVAPGHWSDVRSPHHSDLHQEQPSEVTQGHIPEEMFAMVQSQEDKIILWLYHAARFKEENSSKPFLVDEMQKLFLGLPSQKHEVYYANLFAEMGSNCLGDRAESMQKLRFCQLIVGYGMTPGDLERNLHPHGRLPTSLPQTDPLYGAYKAFALDFAAVHSPSTQKELEQYFLAGDRINADKYLATLENSVLDDPYPYVELTDDRRRAGHWLSVCRECFEGSVRDWVPVDTLTCPWLLEGMEISRYRHRHRLGNHDSLQLADGIYDVYDAVPSAQAAHTRATCLCHSLDAPANETMGEAGQEASSRMNGSRWSGSGISDAKSWLSSLLMENTLLFCLLVVFAGELSWFGHSCRQLLRLWFTFFRPVG
uniref:RxLR effector candidate protein n=2 Tax=Hyaloperonospora arabidopsidis (strain Emoy2) TaxID=559515 RepID=M4C3Q6_HYAAE